MSGPGPWPFKDVPAPLPAVWPPVPALEDEDEPLEGDELDADELEDEQLEALTAPEPTE